MGKGLIVFGDTGGGVGDEQHNIGGLDGGLHLPADLHVEIAAAGQPAASIDEHELDTEPLRFGLLAVGG